MPKFKFVALSNPKSGTESEFKRWYKEHHLNDVAAVPGVTSASLLQCAAGNDRWQYLALYDVEADNPSTVFAEIMRRSGTAMMQISPALDTDGVFFGAFGAAAD